MSDSFAQTRHPQGTAVRPILLGMVLMMVLMVGLLSVQIFSRADSRAPPACDAEPVLAKLHALLGDVALSIRDIRRVGVDSREGHQVCYARIGSHEHVREIKYALHGGVDRQPLRMEVVIEHGYSTRLE